MHFLALRFLLSHTLTGVTVFPQSLLFDHGPAFTGLADQGTVNCVLTSAAIEDLYRVPHCKALELTVRVSRFELYGELNDGLVYLAYRPIGDTEEIAAVVRNNVTV